MAVSDVEAGRHRDGHVDDDWPQQKRLRAAAPLSKCDERKDDRDDGGFRRLVKKCIQEICRKSAVRSFVVQKAPARVRVPLRERQSVQVALGQQMEIVREENRPA